MPARNALFPLVHRFCPVKIYIASKVASILLAQNDNRVYSSRNSFAVDVLKVALFVINATDQFHYMLRSNRLKVALRNILKIEFCTICRARGNYNLQFLLFQNENKKKNISTLHIFIFYFFAFLSTHFCMYKSYITFLTQIYTMHNAVHFSSFSPPRMDTYRTLYMYRGGGRMDIKSIAPER